MRVRARAHAFLLAALAIGALAAPTQVWSADLTVARLFEAPDLAGDGLRSARLTPDGRRVTYLKGSADDKDRLDLWAYDIGARSHARLVDALQLQPEGERVSAEEAARRERQRTAAFKGIVDYAVSPDGRQVLIPLNGDLYLQSLGTAAPPVKLTS
ncbi:MAG: S9 family peptidase, partial [Proteobacteria bacterium]